MNTFVSRIVLACCAMHGAVCSVSAHPVHINAEPNERSSEFASTGLSTLNEDPADSTREPYPNVTHADAKAEAGQAMNTGSETFPIFDRGRLVDDLEFSFDSIYLLDFDSDTDLDIVLTGQSQLRWFENDGAADPEFAPQQILLAPGPEDIDDLYDIVDLDGDGDFDLIGVSTQPAPDLSISWFENDGANTYTEHILGDRPNTNRNVIQTADLNNDGALDIINGAQFSTIFSNDIVVFISNGPGSTTYTRFSTSTAVFGFHAFGAQDCNNNSASELLVAHDLGLLDIELGFTGGTPSVVAQHPLILQPTSGSLVEDASILDFDGDGDLDALVHWHERDFNGLPVRTEIIWYEMQGCVGAPTATPHSIYLRPSRISRLLPVDLEGDGDTDIYAFIDGIPVMFVNAGNNSAFVEREARSGKFIELFGDLDGDGDLDAIGSSGNRFDVLWHEHSDAVNTRSGARFLRLGDALENALDGDTIVTSRDLFSLETVVDLQTDGRTLAILSDGEVERGIDSATLLGNESILEASAASTGIVLSETLDVGLGAPGGASLVGPITMLLPGSKTTVHQNSTLSITSGLIDVMGEVDLAIGAHLELAGNVLLTERAAFRERLVATEEDFGGIVFSLSHLQVGEFTGDGLPDAILVGRFKDAEIVLLENTGTGQFKITPIGSVGDSAVTAISTGDLDQDGDLDFVLSRNENHPVPSEADLAWYENDGAGAFTRHEITNESNFDSVFITDLEHDGDQDIVVNRFSNSSAKVRAYLNNGAPDPTFSFHEITNEPDRILGFDAEDMNGDGLVDLVVAAEYQGADGISVYLNLGPFGYHRINVTDFPYETGPVWAADLNGDARIDIVALNTDGSPSDSAGLIWLERAPGSSLQYLPHIIDTVEDSSRIVPTDIDQDGDLDLLISDPFRTRFLSYYINDGRSSPGFTRVDFDLENDVSRPLSEGSVFDFGMDGDLDLIYTTSSPADGSGDRTVSIAENLGSSSFEITRPGASLSIDGQALLSESVLRIDALSGGLTVTGSLIVAPGASLIGDGEIFGSLSNEGTVEPDPLATFTVTGIYMQAVASGVGAENAILRLEISESSASSLSIGMSASLSGALIVEGPTSYDPPASASFPIVSAASTAGRFSVAFLPGVTPDIEGNGRFLRVDYPVAGVTNGTVSVNLVVDSLSGQIDTEAAEAFDVNGEPVAAAVGDLNNDGLIDLALAVPDPNAPTTAPGSAVVLYNAGSTAGVWNGFTNSTQITVGVDPSAIAFGEADLDGGLDIAVANSADDTVTVITNDGLGTPTSLVVAQVIFVGDDPQGVAFGDLDEDKWDDIAVANFGSDNVTILQNQQGIGPGWMGMGGAQTLPAGDGPIDVIFGDLDEDKWDDVVVLNANDGTVTFFDNAFPPGMFAPPLVLAADAGSLDLGIGDLDADGVNDIFTANPGADSVSIILNNGDSTFEPVVNLPLAGAPRSIAAVDLDDDLDLDLAIVAEDAMGVNTIRVLRNDLTDGQLIFAPDADIDAGSEPLFVFAGDVDNDGQGDLITVNSTSGARSAESGVPAMPIGVVRQSAAPCLGDCDGNGVVEFNDLVSMLFEFGNETAPVECDADASGVVEFNDLVTALFAFGPCN